MKRLALIASLGAALAVVVAAQALRAPGAEPLAPIELRRPNADPDVEREKAPKTKPASQGGQQLRPGRPAPKTQPAPQGDSADDEPVDDDLGTGDDDAGDD